VRRYARARTYRLRLDSKAGVLRLSMPERGSEAKAIAWARGQERWVEQQLDRVPDRIVLADGVCFPLEGQQISICWQTGAGRTPRREGDSLIVGGERERAGTYAMRWLQQRARLVLGAESHDMAEGAGLKIGAVGIGDPRGRWGSCSSRGVLRYSWRLILAPPDVRRATVAHEVAHLLHMNHSPAFHAAHAELLGEDPAPAREWLRRHGRELHRVTL
jgi:predicted metal-dependent hydrolase